MSIPRILPYLENSIAFQKLQIEDDLSVQPIKKIIGYKFILGRRHFISIVNTKNGEKIEKYFPDIKPSINYISDIKVEREDKYTLEEITIELGSDKDLLFINLTNDRIIIGEYVMYLVRKIEPIYECINTYGISIQMDSQWDQLMTYINTETVGTPVKKEDDDGYYHYIKIELEDDTLFGGSHSIEFWRTNDNKIECINFSKEFIEDFWLGLPIDEFKSSEVFLKNQKYKGEIRDEIVLVGNKYEYIENQPKNFIYYITKYKSGQREGTMRLGMGWLISLEEKTFSRISSLLIKKIILK